MSLLQVIILAVVQGLAELLPVLSSAHVVVAEKLMGLDPSSPPMTLLLVTLHTGTMFSVIVYFWLFGKSVTLNTFGPLPGAGPNAGAGNRHIELQVRLTF